MDTIANMLNQIKNAQAVGQTVAEFPFSNLKYEIVQLLSKQGFLGKVDKKGRKAKKMIEVALKYEDGSPAISGLRKISKPGQRIYLDCRRIRQVRQGYGLAIISTSKGLMTNKEARKQKIGGEVICEIW